jgi:hypothetical protein
VSEEEIQQLLQKTMADFWKQNSLGQRYEVIRRALCEAAGVPFEGRVSIL